MGFPLVTLASDLQCPHGGRVMLTSPPRVLASGSAVLNIVPPLPISGCQSGGMTAGGGETGKRYVFKVAIPCQMLVFTRGTTRVLSGGRPLLVVGSQGTALPPGHAVVAGNPGQTRVLAV